MGFYKQKIRYILPGLYLWIYVIILLHNFNRKLGIFNHLELYLSLDKVRQGFIQDLYSNLDKFSYLDIFR